MALRGAFIGFGNVAENGHFPGWRACPEVEIVAATDGSDARRMRVRETSPGINVYADPAEMLAQETLDFVDICTPPGSHAAMIGQAQAAGIHVLCEKPTVTHAAALTALSQEARRRGLVLHTVHNWLKAPICRKITSLIDEAALGTIHRIHWETLRSQPAMAVPAGSAANWRLDPAMAGGGILVDHGWHALYCVRRWAGTQPQSISARLETRKFTDWPLDDTAHITLEFPNATATIHLTWTAETRENWIEIEGTDGRLIVEEAAVVRETGAGRQTWNCPPALSRGSHHPDWFSGVVDDFLTAIKNPQRGSNLPEALFCARAIDLAKASSADGSAVIAFNG
jgi:predicted dehydrogenase